MELASNLVWLVIALTVLLMTAFGLRRGFVRLSAVSAFTLAILVCILLLPVISISDDLLAADQAALPLSAQSWRMAWEGASVGLELLPLIGACLLLLACMSTRSQAMQEADWDTRRQSAWLTQSLRLRPPPSLRS